MYLRHGCRGSAFKSLPRTQGLHRAPAIQAIQQLPAILRKVSFELTEEAAASAWFSVAFGSGVASNLAVGGRFSGVLPVG